MLRNLLTFCLVIVTGLGLFAQAANDDCAMAQAISLDEVVSFSTLDATADGPNHTGCFGENDSIPADIWFTWTAPEDGAVQWSNCGTADYDSRVAVYTATSACDATDDNLVACNDDGANCDVNTSLVAFFATGGVDYVFRMGGFAADTIPVTSGSGTVVLSNIVGGPANDFCNGAITVIEGADQPFSTEGALTDGPDHDNTTGCFGFGSLTIGQDIWYNFTPTVTGTYQWTTCGTIDYDSRLGVYAPGSACPPMPEDLIFCNDDGAGVDCPAGQFHSELFFDATAGETYLLRLGGFGGDSGSGTFTLINNTPPPPPANDLCENAEVAPLITIEEAMDGDFSLFGSTIGATSDADNVIFPQCLNNQDGGEFGDVWYQFETLGNEEITFSILGSGQGNNPAIVFFMDFFTECGVQLDSNTLMQNCIVSTLDNPAPIGVLSGLPAGENQTFLVRVTSRLTSDPPGQFGLILAAEVVSGVQNLDVAKNLEFFPNPVSDRATVRFNLDEATQLDAKVFDVMGRNVSTQQLGLLPRGGNQFTLETSELKAGVYSLQLSNGTAVQTLKFVVN